MVSEPQRNDDSKNGVSLAHEEVQIVLTSPNGNEATNTDVFYLVRLFKYVTSELLQ